ncbi:MAG: protein TolA [Hydrogenophilales bacterium CG17_big_fil_post_rev_8_21_14_2_50_63_12]|nr:MAG: protein TolA [Hydrogenophilales bacterium CG17_big_fil_post_rev_8_21_14_2_50_63_12]
MTRAAPFQHVSAGGMSLLVHGLFIAFLLFGVSWRSLPHLPVEAELWSALPEPPAPLPPPLPEPAPEPVPAAPPPEVAKPEVAKPDIALERAEKKRHEEAAREQAALRRKADEHARIEKEKGEKAAQAAKLRQEARQEIERKRLEQELARQTREELDAEETQLRGVHQRQGGASRQARLVGEFQDRIRGKIHDYVRLPHNLVGNPEVVFLVSLLPNGEVVRVDRVRGSGQPAYDDEMERAILKASPLPLPHDPEVARAFREGGLMLKFRAFEEAAASR